MPADGDTIHVRLLWKEAGNSGGLWYSMDGFMAGGDFAIRVGDWSRAVLALPARKELDLTLISRAPIILEAKVYANRW